MHKSIKKHFFTIEMKLSKDCPFFACVSPARFLFLLAMGGVLLLIPATVYANNLSITNVTWANHDSTNDTIDVQFDISWDNSWRNSINYDAVWVYFRYMYTSVDDTKACLLKTAGTNPANCSQGTGTPIDIVVPSDLKGAFIMRSEPGSGSVSVTSVQLCWDYDVAVGVSDGQLLDEADVSGIEMVYIPTGDFALGDGSGFTESTYALHVADNNDTLISDKVTEDLTCDSNGNDDIDTSPIAIDGDGGIDTDANGTIDNADFPTGYNAFYLMKYEVTEGQWVKFFNEQDDAYKTVLDITSATGKNSDSTVDRNTIAWTSGDATTQREDRAMNWLSWPNLASFCDWSCTRPMTETEYEKASRGATSAFLSEKAFGSATDINGILAAEIISGAGEDGTETVSDTDANACYNNITFTTGHATYDQDDGPVRSGIFAESATNRRSSGASYYGVMELSGNVNEFVVSIGANDGRNFQGTHGDGKLSKYGVTEWGYADNTDWPGYDGTCCVDLGTGTGVRGGAWDDTSVTRLSVSDRLVATNESASRDNSYGGRCARTAP